MLMNLSVGASFMEKFYFAMSPFFRVLQPVLSAIEWTTLGHPTVGASLMWRRKLEESSLRSTSMKSPASHLR